MNVTIIGCGWLGTQVGKFLTDSGYSVYGSFRSEQQKAKIADSGIEPFYLNLDINSQISIKITEPTDVLLLSLPPLKKEVPEYYASILVDIVQQFSKDVHVIFTGSIGVYPQKPSVFDESYAFLPEEKMTVLRNAETRLGSLQKDKLTILRLGGLTGPDRHPIYRLSGKALSQNGNAPINLIDSRDICNAILTIIDQNIFGETFNLVYPDHPQKKVYYNDLANRLDLPPVSFGSQSTPNRVIAGDKITEQTSFRYQFDLQNID